MKNAIVLIFTILLTNITIARNDEDSVLVKLNQIIDRKAKFDQKKENKINILKELIKDDASLLRKYEINQKLYEEYRKYKTDSAVAYAKKNLKIANILKQADLVQETRLHLVILYSSSGMFRESEEILKNIDKNNLPSKLLSGYYEAWFLFYSYYSANKNPDLYVRKIELYRDSLLNSLDPASSEYKINNIEQDIYLRNPHKAKDTLFRMLKTTDNQTPEYAMITFLLGETYRLLGNRDLQKHYLALSAITDIKNSTKDNSSLHHLAYLCYREGDIDKAYKYSQSALEDAIFCNVQFRTIYLSEFYTIINAAYKEKSEKQKSQLQLYLILISLLSVFLIIAVVHVYKQKDNVSKIRKKLDIMNHELMKLNDDISRKNEQLNERNALLSESNKIKEEYIGHFFNLCSTYINKIEDYRKTLNKKAITGKHQELFRMLKSTSVIDDEVDELYRNFDNIFLNIYPDFVKEFNALLVEEEKIVPKQNEKLNTELRIYALIRLGITDSVKIASFLRYSLSTIYNYRTKTRNKAAVSRDEFENMVMKIGAVLRG